MTKITFIGAGSTVFTRDLLNDILSFPELHEVTITLQDIDAQRLEDSQIVANHAARKHGANPTIEATLDRRAALDGADYVITMFQIGGYKPATVTDFEVPKRYGLRHTIADTLGVGGIMRALRTFPVLQAMSREMEELCPDTLHLNYANPMAMLVWALSRSASLRTVGLCHSVPNTAEELAQDLGLAVEELNYMVAGINHVAFFLRLERDGEDLYPALFRLAETGQVPDNNRVRYDLLQRVGYFVTESSEHLAEYVPWYIKRDRPDLIERFNIPLDEYIRRCEAQIVLWNFARDELLAGHPMPFEKERSAEFAPLIIHSMETGQPRTVYGNVMNAGLIDNLPGDCCVEVPCLVDRNGVQPVRIGRIPPQLAAIMQTNINVQALAVEAMLTGRREHIYHAAMLDPHTAAELDLDQIFALVDDLIEEHGDLLPAFH